MSEPANTQQQPQQAPQTQPAQQPAQPTFDYEKLANLINGKQSVTEDTVLKSYFKQQGLSADEMTQAISAYKAEKAKNTPDVAAIQNDLTAERSARLAAEINQAATLEAIKQGVDIKSIPYLLKMADFKTVTGDDGGIIADKLTEAIKTVLDDIPAFKGNVGQNQSSGNNSTGFTKIGGDGQQQGNATEDRLRGIFGIRTK